MFRRGAWEANRGFFKATCLASWAVRYRWYHRRDTFSINAGGPWAAGAPDLAGCRWVAWATQTSTTRQITGMQAFHRWAA